MVRRRHGVPALLAGAVVAVVGCGQAWISPPAQGKRAPAQGAAAAMEEAVGRRGALGAIGIAGLWAPLSGSEPAYASGGSTAGKYSTIPSAKRRFYGRVRQGIYAFLSMEKPISAGKLDDPVVEQFFAKDIIKQKGGEKIKGCQFSECVTKEKRTSRWLDFKISADLLASAFRYDSSDVADFLPQVKLIRSFAKKVEKMQGSISKGDVEGAKAQYQICKADLARYVPMVELANLESEDYTHEWDTKPQVWCQGSFCV
jgi:hypothetical protein